MLCTQLAVFDLCGVSLLHGWIADAESSTAMKKLSKMSYNEATLTVFGGLADDPLVASLRSSLSASARIQINNRCLQTHLTFVSQHLYLHLMRLNE